MRQRHMLGRALTSNSANFGGWITGPYVLLWSHRALLLRIVATTLKQRHAGSLLGMSWLVIAPALLISTYIFMFAGVLGIRPPGLGLDQYAFHMSLGLVLLLTTTQALSTATGALSQEPGLLFNQVFPAELFPVREVLAASPLLIFAAIITPPFGLAVGHFGWVWLLLPLLLILLLMTLIGCAWILSLANLIIRDTPQLLAYVLTLFMLTSPIAFVPEMLPPGARFLVILNPFAAYVRSFQEIMVLGNAPSVLLTSVVVATAFIIFHGGYALFKRGKGIIAENM